MRVTLRLDDKYREAVERRISELQAESVRELEEAGESELACEVAETDPDASTYVKCLVREDLSEAGLLPDGENE